MAAPLVVAMSDKEIEARATAAPYAPLTYERRVRDNLELTLPKPYLLRAMQAPDTEHPYEPGHRSHNLSVLQQHCAFFYQNDDGIIYPWETYAGFTQIGFNGWILSPFFPIYIDNMHRSTHGSYSGTYDNEGRYVPANFEFIFSRYSPTVPDKLSFGKLWEMTEGNRDAFDLFGWFYDR